MKNIHINKIIFSPKKQNYFLDQFDYKSQIISFLQYSVNVYSSSIFFRDKQNYIYKKRKS